MTSPRSIAWARAGVSLPVAMPPGAGGLRATGSDSCRRAEPSILRQSGFTTCRSWSTESTAGSECFTAMRVLMTTDPIGGVWNYTLELCAALAARGVRVSVAVLGRELSAEQRNQFRRWPQIDLYESQFRLEWMPDPWGDLDRAADWLLSLERRCGADIIHLNHLMHANLPWRAPALTVGHSCVLSWWAATQEPGSVLPVEWSVYRRKVTESLRAAPCVVAPTNVMLGELQRFYGPLQRALVVNNARSRHGFGTGPKERLVLSAGRLWDRAKNIESLAAVAQHLDTRVAVAGETL